jgi:AraC-like DNA-binding protein
MRTERVVVATSHFVVKEVRCSDDHTGWSQPEWSSLVQVVLVKRGRFRHESRAHALTADPTTGYLHSPGHEQRFSHPTGGDVCTSVTFTNDALTSEPWLQSAIGQAAPEVRVDGRLELAHRSLLRSGADADLGAAEALLDLLALSLRSSAASVSPAPGRRELAERAREAIASGESASASLVGLAQLLETSPSHLSRTFRHHIGVTVSRYRNRVRVSKALDRLENGETDLAALGVSLGFSDQAHLSRVMRAELGRTPRRAAALMGHAAQARR